MKKNTVWAMMLFAMVFAGCSDIDLNNVDTNISVPVNDMVVPLNFDNLKLGSMIDVDDDSKLREINGEYAVVVEGDYKSDRIHVPAFVAKAEDIGDINGTMTKAQPRGKSAASRPKHADAAVPQAIAEYVIPTAKEIISANADKVDEAIRSLKGLDADTKFHFALNLDLNGTLFKVVKSIHIENFAVQVPRGIVGSVYVKNADGSKVIADYDSETGLVSFVGKNIESTTGVLELEGEVKALNADLLADAFHRAVASNGRGHRVDSESDFSFSETFGVTSGAVVVYDTDFRNAALSTEEMFDALPGDVGYKSSGTMDDVVVKSFSGTFDYHADDYSIDDVSLADVPDVLRQSGTSLRLDNPQVYVYLNNPIADGEGRTITASSNLSVVAKNHDGQTRKFEMDESVQANTSDYFFYLSPRPVADDEKYAGFEGATHIPFTALADVLSCITDAGNATLDESKGEGLPESLSISAVNTHVVGVDVDAFELDKDYFINGRYAFVAPLALGEESRIKYTDTVTGWHSSVDGILITKLGLTASVTTDVPFELQLRITPIDESGERIEGSYSTLIIPADASNAPVNLVIEGNIRDLDGIKIEALAVSKEARPLTPNMNISLSDLKVKVSGKYENEL